MAALNRDVFEPENDVEAQAIRALLEDHDIEATDRDRDGFPERVSCRGADGVITLDTVRCKLGK